MKFIIDMQLPPRLTEWFRREGHDAVHAGDVGLSRAPDEAILEFGRSSGRIVVTADLDYPRILGLTKALNPGVLLLRGGNFDQREAQSRVSRALEKLQEDQFINAIVVVERHRIRRRPLPISG